MIRELIRTLVGDLRVRASLHDVNADLWATYYATKTQLRGPR